MRDWSMDQVILAPGEAAKELNLRKQELEALRKQLDETRKGIESLRAAISTYSRTPWSQVPVAAVANMKNRLKRLLAIGGA